MTPAPHALPTAEMERATIVIVGEARSAESAPATVEPMDAGAATACGAATGDGTGISVAVRWWRIGGFVLVVVVVDEAVVDVDVDVDGVVVVVDVDGVVVVVVVAVVVVVVAVAVVIVVVVVDVVEVVGRILV